MKNKNYLFIITYIISIYNINHISAKNVNNNRGGSDKQLLLNTEVQRLSQTNMTTSEKIKQLKAFAKKNGISEAETRKINIQERLY